MKKLPSETDNVKKKNTKKKLLKVKTEASSSLIGSTKFKKVNFTVLLEVIAEIQKTWPDFTYEAPEDDNSIF
jgi:hypothetical protein